MNSTRVTVTVVFFLGLCMCFFSYTMIEDGGFYSPRILKGGIVFTCMSIVVFVFPGNYISLGNAEPFKDFLKKTSTITKTIWVLALVLSIILSNYIESILTT